MASDRNMGLPVLRSRNSRMTRSWSPMVEVSGVGLTVVTGRPHRRVRLPLARRVRAGRKELRHPLARRLEGDGEGLVEAVAALVDALHALSLIHI